MKQCHTFIFGPAVWPVPGAVDGGSTTCTSSSSSVSSTRAFLEALGPLVDWTRCTTACLFLPLEFLLRGFRAAVPHSAMVLIEFASVSASLKTLVNFKMRCHERETIKPPRSWYPPSPRHSCCHWGTPAKEAHLHNCYHQHRMLPRQRDPWTSCESRERLPVIDFFCFLGITLWVSKRSWLHRHSHLSP